jgi:hypothetical protein
MSARCQDGENSSSEIFHSLPEEDENVSSSNTLESVSDSGSSQTG